MVPRQGILSAVFLAFFFLISICLAQAVDQKPLDVPIPTTQSAYKVGAAIPVSCLNRTIETGEHVMDEKGVLQYIPFPTCNETGRPLELYFGIEKEINCTIDFIDDTFFHLLEFYVHSDAPLTCRIPARPFMSSDSTLIVDGANINAAPQYIPLVFALTGTLQLSHLHVSNNLNVLLHAAPKSVAPGVIDSATAYSVSHLTKNTKIVIGDSLPLRLSVRWYPTTSLPSGWAGVGGHLFFSTLVYCLLSAGAATAICVAYFRGIDLPKRLRSHGRERTFTTGSRGYSGYGYGVGTPNGNGYGFSGPGKSD